MTWAQSLSFSVEDQEPKPGCLTPTRMYQHSAGTNANGLQPGACCLSAALGQVTPFHLSCHTKNTASPTIQPSCWLPQTLRNWNHPRVPFQVTDDCLWLSFKIPPPSPYIVCFLGLNLRPSSSMTHWLPQLQICMLLILKFISLAQISQLSSRSMFFFFLLFCFVFFLLLSSSFHQDNYLT